MRHVALFAGAGGFMFAAEKEGFKNTWANELDKSCCDFLELNFPETKINRKSISELNQKDINEIPGPVDLLTAGFPCQSFSGAGGEMKLFEDPRGKLFFDIARIIKLMKHSPKVVLLENVPILKTFDNGSLLQTVITDMRFAGYWVKEHHAEILNSSEYGATPQNRERVYIVCANKKFFKSNPFDFGKIRKRERKKLFEVIDRTKKQPDDYYLSMESKYYKMIEDVAKKNCKERLFQIRRVEARACRKEFCPTLTASMGEGGHNVPFLYDEFGLRRLTEDECFRLQGFDTGSLIFTDEIKRTDKLKMAGNAISVETVRNIISNIVDQLLSIDEEGGENERSETTMALSI